ncbi:MAG: hypothetical protein ACYDAD_02130 [Acidimicrobiales bacterium]
MRPAGAALPAVALVLALALVCASCGGSGSSSAGSSGSSTSSPPVTLNTGPAPWPRPTDEAAFIRASGLTALPQERLELHEHAHLDVFVDGAPVPVPALLGIATKPRVTFSPLHTHDGSGVIHIESARPQRFTLGALFTEWGVRLTSTCVGGYCQPTIPIQVVVDGTPQPAGSDPAQIALTRHEEVAVVIGRAPAEVPASFNFTGGL